MEVNLIFQTMNIIKNIKMSISLFHSNELNKNIILHLSLWCSISIPLYVPDKPTILLKIVIEELLVFSKFFSPL